MDRSSGEMVGTTGQAAAVLRLGFSGLRRRWWSSLNATLGTAMVVGALVALLAIAAGYSEALRLAAADDNVMILRAGARSEMESSLTGAQVQLIVNTPAFAARGGRAAPAGEVYAVANIEGANGEPANVAVRGITASSLALRPSVRLVEGRMFSPGRREIVVGRMAQRRFGGLALGSRFAFAGGDWTVVGVFEAEGGLAESEIWSDAPMVQSSYSRGDNYSVVVAHLPASITPARLQETLNEDPRLNVRVVRQADYYGEQAEGLRGFVRTLGYGIGILMAIGAVFASLNTGFAHVKARAKELATLAAVGWSERSLMLAVAAESIGLSLAGALLGALFAYLLFDGRVVSTLFYSKDFTQVVFAFSVSWGVLAQAALMALAIGAAGMVGPALKVRSLPLARILGNRR